MEELKVVRAELEALIQLRITVPLSVAEQARYTALCERERQLLTPCRIGAGAAVVMPAIA